MRMLTVKQRRFVAAYAGNAVEAARKAGYKGNDATLRAVASENLTKPNIAKAIAEREQSELEPLIADRQTRQAFWTKAMHDEDLPMRDRLRASELLGKSEGDFLERAQTVSDPDDPIVQLFAGLGNGRVVG